MRMSDPTMWCCGCEEWSPAMSTGGGDEQLRVRAVCVAGVAGVRGLRGRTVEDYQAQVLARARGRQARVTTVRGCGCDTVNINSSAVSSLHAHHTHVHTTCHSR